MCVPQLFPQPTAKALKLSASGFHRSQIQEPNLRLPASIARSNRQKQHQPLIPPRRPVPVSSYDSRQSHSRVRLPPNPLQTRPACSLSSPHSQCPRCARLPLNLPQPPRQIPASRSSHAQTSLAVQRHVRTPPPTPAS